MTNTIPLTASLERTPETTHVVSRWYIPGGSDYTGAVPMTLFFSEEAEASAYTAKYEQCPEMASMMTIAEHDEISRKIAASHRSAKAA